MQLSNTILRQALLVLALGLTNTNGKAANHSPARQLATLIPPFAALANHLLDLI
jgi:hypothetical protein